MKDRYTLRYLPLFEEELTDIVNHNKYKLKKPSAADNLVKKNYVVYYVVIDDVMEVRRIVYSRRDRENLV